MRPSLVAVLALACLAAAASPPAKVGCRVTVSPLTLAGTYSARQAATEPSPSKVPTTVHGLVDMMVTATDGEIEARERCGGGAGKEVAATPSTTATRPP